MNHPKLNWDIGTAYDLFISLNAIHQPSDYGLRASWAAGVRSRLSTEARETLEIANTLIRIPLHLAYELPDPKNADSLLKFFDTIPSEERLPKLFFTERTNEDYRQVLLNTHPKKKWSPTETKIIREHFRNPFNQSDPANFNLLYNCWSSRKTFGDRYYTAIKLYAESFYIEEESRILPSLQRGLSHAQARAGSLPVPALLEELSLGVRLSEILNVTNLILAPSFWGAPFIFFQHLNLQTMVLLFGARPDDMALVPGDVIPESLLRGLKALADPTRLRILRYLADGPQTPTQLARILRLRAPTVIHHLMALRMAGLVQVTLSSQGDRHYATRLEGFYTTQDQLEKFVNGE